MSDSIIMVRVACAAADCLYPELLRTEDLGAFEQIAAADMRSMMIESLTGEPFFACDSTTQGYRKVLFLRLARIPG